MIREILMSQMERQESNRKWWTHNTMSYDWKDPIEKERFSSAWFDDADRRFIHASRLFTGKENPFEDLMDLPSLAGKRVLEIGCGMGFHSELLARSGANLTSIDLSPTSVEATRKRFAVRGLTADIREMDALKLGELDGTFDLIWSWGVLHHSSHTARAIRAASKKLAEGGHLKLMVYHLGGASAYVTMVRRYLAGFWTGKDLDDLLWRDADGFLARFYTRDSFRDLLYGFFENVDIEVFGQDADAVPLPRQIRPLGLRLLSEKKQIERAGRVGSMIWADCSRPLG